MATQTKKPGRKAKSRFYHVRWSIVGLNEERAAEVLGVTIDDVKRFDLEGCPMAEQLLLLWDNKHVGVPGWDGFLFSRGVLRYKDRRWTPQTILLFRDQDEEIRRLRNELEKLESWRGVSQSIIKKLAG